MSKPEQRLRVSAKKRVDEAFAAIAEEVLRAEEKFPGWPLDLVHGAAIVAEESGEAVKAALQSQYENRNLLGYREELIQTAAMCVRALLDLDHREGVA